MSIYEDSLLMIYCCVVAGILGAVLGSFLNCVAFRISRGESFFGGHSRCPVCGHNLGVTDLIPIFSWLFLGGKCRYCKTKISVRYPITEAVFSLMTVLCLLKFDLSAECVRNLIFGCCLFCLSLVDLEILIIPNGCLLTAAVAWVAALPLMNMGMGNILIHLLSAVIFGGGMLLLSLAADHILNKESLGGGDIKLFAVMGLYLGMTASLFALLLSCILGLFFAVCRGKKTLGEGEHFPFGPSIAAATWIMLLYGQPVVNWYLQISGLG